MKLILKNVFNILTLFRRDGQKFFCDDPTINNFKKYTFFNYLQRRLLSEQNKFTVMIVFYSNLGSQQIQNTLKYLITLMCF